MAWFRVDDKLHDHPKIRKLRRDKMAALGLWTACGSWSADTLSDGFVPAEIVQRFDPDEGLAKRLVEVGLWMQDEQDGEDGYSFHQWTDHQPTKAEVERRRGEARERMRKRRAGSTEQPDNGSHRVRANIERTTSNGFASTVPHTPADIDFQQPPTGDQRKAPGNPQVKDSVRANIERTAREVRHPDPTRPSLTAPSVAALPDPDWFTDFYAAYPRRVERRKAEQAWKAALKRKADPQQMIAAAKRYAGDSRGTEARFIKHPASWLNAGCYEDEHPTQPTAPVKAALGSFEEYRTAAAGKEAARLLGIGFNPRPQPPSDKTSYDEWARMTAVEWIDAHEQEIRDALTERKTG